MAAHTSQRIRRFRFERPQKIAAALLFVLLAQCLWIVAHRSLSGTDYQFARCGREIWEKPSPLTGYFTTCGNISDGTLAYRAAGLPLSIERMLMGQASSTSTWEMRHEVGYIHLLLVSLFMLAGLALGGCIWWVTRRLYGDSGGYIALALYCFSPEVVRACTYPNNEILAALGLFALIYTAIGVAHAMQGPVRKWRPRIVLLTVIFGFTAAAHVSTFLLGLLLSLVLMGYLAEGRRSYLPTLLILWVCGALFLLFASYAFHPDAFSYVFRSAAGKLWFSMDAMRTFFSSLSNAATTIAAAGALALYAAIRRSRYFGNTAPLAIAVFLMLLVTTGAKSEPWLWALPFLLTFIAGIYADMLDLPRYRKPFLWITGGLVTTQAVLGLASLPGLLR
ncbi:MAG: hypothetical protein HIU93_03745 [Acidobacteria bacterium]|nr:hypothetical protein [Acidobacteriota bacterium]MBW4044374.1 hypothetical protein [Acidobacteriota bacterium]